MSKFRSLKKKLLAVLCAFASGFSGAGAAPGEFLDVTNPYNAWGDSLNFSNEALSKFRGVLADVSKKIAGTEDFSHGIWMNRNFSI